MNETKCRIIVRTRSGGSCELCGQEAVQQHHRRNRSQGGLWQPSNILHLCVGCHELIGRNIDAVKVLGHTIQGTQRPPLAVPVVLYTNTTERDNLQVWLTDDGDYSMSPPCCCGLPVDRCFRCCLGSHLLCERPVEPVGVYPNQGMRS